MKHLLAELKNLLGDKTLQYDRNKKRRFNQLATQYFAVLALKLGVSRTRVKFINGGEGYPGQAYFVGMWGEQNGIYIELTQVLHKPVFVFREIFHQEDYNGGPNQYVWDVGSQRSVVEDDADHDEILVALLKLKK